MSFYRSNQVYYQYTHSCTYISLYSQLHTDALTFTHSHINTLTFTHSHTNIDINIRNASTFNRNLNYDNNISFILLTQTVATILAKHSKMSIRQKSQLYCLFDPVLGFKIKLLHIFNFMLFIEWVRRKFTHSINYNGF